MRRSKHSLSHYKLFTMNMGKLIPVTWFEVLPGDTIQQNTTALVRASPLLSPVMHPVVVRLHHWYVPNRLLWDNWEDFITGGADGTDASEHPYVTAASGAEGTIYDYLGLPPGTYAGTFKWNALPLNAYQLIWNEFYRDQDLVTAATIDTADGSCGSSSTIQNVAWEKDYFTTARTTEFKGTEVTIPLGDNAPVLGLGTHTQTFATGPQTVYETGASASSSFAKYKDVDDATNDQKLYIEEDPDSAGYPGIYADLSNATGISINDLRLAISLQRYQEARQKFGSRYVEYLKYLGVKPSDGRLQRPEYLGGGRQTISFSEIIQTAEGASAPVGTLLGHGVTAMRSRKNRRFFEEHGICMTLMSVVPKSIYAGAVPRKWLREVKEDYWQKELEGIGDQEITNREAFAEHASPAGTFGYQARYDEYRYHPSQIAGEFHSTFNYWHLARIYGSDPSLNSTFVQCSPSNRVFADQVNDSLKIYAANSIQARRLVSSQHKPSRI